MSYPAPARPGADEHVEYFGKYIALVPEGDVRALLERQITETASYIRSRGDNWAMSRYAPGKWSVKEVIGHLCDAERIFSYRALRIARGDKTPLAGFNENEYVPNGNFESRSTAGLLEEFAAIRAATLIMMRSFDEAAWARRGISGEKEISVRALAYIICGHERHHLAILRDRYT
jgi:hypothetical protein